MEVNSSDEILPNTAAISTTTITRFSYPTSKPLLGLVPPQNQAGDSLAAVQQLIEMVKHNLEQQQKFWAFVKAAHI